MPQSKHASEKGLRERAGKWEYRFQYKGKPFSLVTDLAAVPENILAAQALKALHQAELRKGKKFFRVVSVDLAQAVPKFMAWYRSEHGNGKCKWAASLMASFQYWCEESRVPLPKLGPAQMEDFKQWRRSTSIKDNTLRKQLLLLGQFFRYCRKQGWMDSDPFAKGQDAEVKIPAEQDSDAMRVLSPAEEVKYLAAAKECQDLIDVATIMAQQGPRPDEALSLQQAHVDLFRREFTIWDNSAEGKSKNAHRTLRMTDDVFRIFGRRLAEPRLWVFPSTKNDNHRLTLQKAHERAELGCGIKCRLYDFRHTFATRFALAGGSLPLLVKILGHADLSLLMRYVHPSQEDMNRAMDWYQTTGMTAKAVEGIWVPEKLDGVTFGPTTTEKLDGIGPTSNNSAVKGRKAKAS